MDNPTHYPWEDPAGWFDQWKARRESPGPAVYVDFEANEWADLPVLFAAAQQKINQGQLKPWKPLDQIPRDVPPLLLRIVIAGAEVLRVPLVIKEPSTEETISAAEKQLEAAEAQLKEVGA